MRWLLLLIALPLLWCASCGDDDFGQDFGAFRDQSGTVDAATVE
jgi:hypothetical protein